MASSTFDNSSLYIVPSGIKAGTVFPIKPLGTANLNFTRSNDTATRVNSAGLIEKVRTNLILQSEAFDTASWFKSSTTVTANAGVAPNGTTTADKVVPTTTGTSRWVEQARAITVSIPHTNSFYVKADGFSWVVIHHIDGSVGAWFNVSNGTIGTVTAGNTAAIENAGNGWYRCIVAKTSGGSTGYAVVQLADADNSTTATASGTNGVLVWGAQLETGDIATPYIPTTTAAVSVGMLQNIPRIDYTGGGCGKLLLEPQRTNLVLFSEQINNAAWSPTRATITANQIISPDGFTNADLITDTTFTNNQNFTEQSIAVSNANVTYSIFVKKGSADFVSFGFFDNAFHGFVVNTTTWASTHSFGSASSFQAVNYGNGWYRLSMNKTAATNFIFTSVAVQQNSTGANYNGTSSLSAYFWGAQVEVGSYATSYIPTLGASVTRSADAASKTGISSLIGQTAGTMFLDIDFVAPVGVGVMMQISDIDNSVAIFCIGSTLFFSANGIIFSYVQATNEKIKIGYAYASGNSAIYVNGVEKSLLTSAFTITGLNRINLGTNVGFGENERLIVNTAALYPVRLSNAQLQTLTTL